MIMKNTHHDHHDDADSLLRAKHAVDQQPETHGSRIREVFQKFSHKASLVVGTPWAFFTAALVVVVWAISGRIFRYSDTWQLVINTGTTIVTFLMVFLIQNTQNRDAKAIHLKLDELIRSKRGARNTLLDLENCTDEELAAIEEEFKRIRRRAEHHPQHPEHLPHPQHAGHAGHSSHTSEPHSR